MTHNRIKVSFDGKVFEISTLDGMVKSKKTGLKLSQKLYLYLHYSFNINSKKEEILIEKVLWD